MAENLFGKRISAPGTQDSWGIPLSFPLSKKCFIERMIDLCKECIVALLPGRLRWTSSVKLGYSGAIASRRRLKFSSISTISKVGGRVLVDHEGWDVLGICRLDWLSNLVQNVVPEKKIVGGLPCSREYPIDCSKGLKGSEPRKSAANDMVSSCENHNPLT